MDTLPVELVAHIGRFLDEQSLGSFILAARRYGQILTPFLYDHAIEHINPKDKLLVDRDLWSFGDVELPAPWFGYKSKMVQCAKHWRSDMILNYFSTKPLDLVMAPYMDEICSIYELGETLLHQAAATDNIDLTRLLLDRGASVDTRTYAGTTPLHYAIRSASTQIIQLLLDNEADILAQTKATESAMVFAIASNTADVVTTVLEAMRAAGGDISKSDLAGNTHLHQAARRRNTPATQILLDNGVDPQKQNHSGYTAVHVAAVDARNMDLLALLVSHIKSAGGDIAAVTEFGQTPLHSALTIDNPDIARFLIQQGVDIRAQDGDGSTAVGLASRRRFKRSIRMLLEEYPENWTPEELHYECCKSAIEGDVEAVNRMLALMKAGKLAMDVNKQQDHRRCTVLHTLLLSKQEITLPCLQIVEAITQAGGSVDIQDLYQDTPLHSFMKSSAPGIKNKSYRALFQTLLNALNDPSIKDRRGNTLLHHAAQGGDAEIVRLILAKLPAGGVTVKNCRGITPLHFAAGAADSEQISQLLLSSGASVNEKCEKGLTALHIAAKNEYIRQSMPCLKLLVQEGANISLCCDSGNPPIHYAADAEWDDAVGFLVDAGGPGHEGCSNCERRIAPWRLQGEERESALWNLRGQDQEEAFNQLSVLVD